MRLNYLVTKMLLLAAFAALAACHDDDKPGEEHEGEGQLLVSVGNPGRQALTLRVYGETLSKPLESRFDATADTRMLDAWLPTGHYDLVALAKTAEQITVSRTDRFNSVTLAATMPDGSSLLPALDTPVYVTLQSNVTLSEGETTRVTLAPEDIRKIVRFTVTAPVGLLDGPLDATLSGIAKEINLSTGLTAGNATLGLTLPAPDAGQTSRATAGILGITPSAGDHLLTLTWQSADGQTLTYSEDVSEQLFKAEEAGADTLDVAVTIRMNIPIRLYTGIQTRATIDTFDQTPVSIAVGTASGNYSEAWEGIAGNNEIALSPERYYLADGSPLYLRSYYPAAPLENGSVHYTLTGQEDLLLSVEQSGSLADRFHPEKSPLIHRHLLSQLNFKIKLQGATDSYLIRSVTLKGLAQQARVDLFTETVEPIGEAAPVVIYTDPGTGGFPIVNGVVTLPGYVLVQPDARLTLDLVLNIDGNPANDKVFTNVPVNFTGGGTEGGNAYEVEISLQVPDIPDVPDDPDIPVDPDDPVNPDPGPDPGPGPGPTPPPTPVEPDAANGIKVTVTAKVTNWETGENGGVEV